MREPTGAAAQTYLHMLAAYKAEFGIPPLIHDEVGDERYFIVGCGKRHRHEFHRYNHLGQCCVEFMATNHCYTIDTEDDPDPHRKGSFWNYDHTEDIPNQHFEKVIFENLPRIMFENPGWCLVGIKTAFRILQSNGWVIVRTAQMAHGQVAGDNVREALQIAGFVNTTEVLDNHGGIAAIWAQRP